MSVDVSDLDPHAGTLKHKSLRLTEWQDDAIERMRREYAERDEYPRPPAYSAVVRTIVAEWLADYCDEPERFVDDGELLEAAVEAAVTSGKAASKRAKWRDRAESHLRDLFDGHFAARPADLRGPEGAVASFRTEAEAYREYGPWSDERYSEEMEWLDGRLDEYEQAYEARDLVPTDGFAGFEAVRVGAGIQRLRADASEVADDLVRRATGSAYDPDATVESVAREWDVPEAAVEVVVDDVLTPAGTDWRQALKDGEGVDFATVVDGADDATERVETVEAPPLTDAGDDNATETPETEASHTDAGESEVDGTEYVCACGAAYPSRAARDGHRTHCDATETGAGGDDADDDGDAVEAATEADDDAENGDADGADGETGSGLDAADLAPDVAVETAVDLLRAGGDRDPMRARDLRRVTETENERRAAVEAARQRLADDDDADAGEVEASDADAGEVEASDADAGDGAPTDGGDGAGDADDDGDAVEAATDGGVRRPDRGDGDTPGGGGRR